MMIITILIVQRQRSHADVQHTDPLAAQRAMMCDIKQVKNFISQLGISKVRDFQISSTSRS